MEPQRAIIGPQFMPVQQLQDLIPVGVQDQFKLAAEANHAQQEDTQRVVDSIENLREEMMKKYDAMAKEIALLRVNNARLEEEKQTMAVAFRSAQNNQTSLIDQLTKSLREVRTALATTNRGLHKLESKYREHAHPYGTYTNCWEARISHGPKCKAKNGGEFYTGTT